MNYIDARHKALTEWVAQELCLSLNQLTLTPLGGDAGFRRYFRYEHPSKWLAVDAPPTTENTTQFLNINQYLQELGLRTPQIKAANCDLGFLLVEDLGDQLLSQALTIENVRNLYQQGFQSIKLMQHGSRADFLPEYDANLLHTELSLFTEWFVEKLLGINLTSDESADIKETFSQLVVCAQAQPYSFVHRDFHSRNLLITPDQALAVIDFQGGLWGPCTYDLVSLIKDCYIRWPKTLVAQFIEDYYQQSTELKQRVSAQEFKRWVDWMALQRHIKVLGIFARLYLRDAKPNYLGDLPLVIRYTLEASSEYPQLAPFAEWFEQRLLPAIEMQPWYKNYRFAGDAP